MVELSSKSNEGAAALVQFEKGLRVPVGAVSPLWFIYAGAASAGLAYWWMSRWTRPQNLEALMAAKAAHPEVVADPVPEPAPPAVDPEPLALSAEPALETLEAVADAVVDALESVGEALEDDTEALEAAVFSAPVLADATPEPTAEPVAPVSAEPAPVLEAEPALEALAEEAAIPEATPKAAAPRKSRAKTAAPPPAESE